MNVSFLFCFFCLFTFDFQYAPTRELGRDCLSSSVCESSCRAVNLGKFGIKKVVILHR